VSPIDIEETKANSRDLDTDVAAIHERLKMTQDNLTEWQTKLARRRAELPELEAELARLKTASGVTEEMVAKVEPKPRTEEEIELTPRRK
jgi:hypothetical protein